ncbi:MAG: hypothetical protein ACREQA_22320 [Candidatus Binatia bacterium]
MTRDDFEEVARLCEAVFGHASPRQHWIWKLQDNPYVSRVTAVGWVLESKGHVVGFLGSIPQPMWVGHHQVTACFATGYAVLPEHRFAGLQLAQAFSRQDSVELLGNATANQPAERIFSRFGFVPVSGSDEILYAFLDSSKLVVGLARRYRWSRAASSALGWLAGGPLALYTDWRVSGPQPARGMEVSGADDALHAMADVGQCWRDQYLVTNPRDQTFLQWRVFHAATDHAAPAVAVARRGGRPVGYACWRLRRLDTSTGWTRAELLDLFCSPNEPEVFDTLVAAVVKQAKQARASILQVRFLSGQWRRRLQQYGWLRRRTKYVPLWIKAVDPHCTALLPRMDDWYFAPLDGDAAM